MCNTEYTVTVEGVGVLDVCDTFYKVSVIANMFREWFPDRVIEIKGGPIRD